MLCDHPYKTTNTSTRIFVFCCSGATPWIMCKSANESMAIQGMTNLSIYILLIEEIPNNHLRCIKPCTFWDKPPIKLVQDFFHQQYVTFLIHTRYLHVSFHPLQNPCPLHSIMHNWCTPQCDSGVFPVIQTGVVKVNNEPALKVTFNLGIVYDC